MYDLVLEDLIIYGSLIIYLHPSQKVLIANCTIYGGIKIRYFDEIQGQRATMFIMDDYLMNTELEEAAVPECEWVLEQTARNAMWERLIPGYEFMNRNQKKSAKRVHAYDTGFFPGDYRPQPEDYLKAKEKINNMSNECFNIPSVKDFNYNSPVCLSTFDCCAATPVERYGVVPQLKAKQEKENNMAYGYTTEITNNTETQQRNYLKRRIDEVQFLKSQEIGNKFNLNAPDAPKTKDELMAAFTGGKFTLDPNSFNADGKLTVWSWLDAFSWRTADTQFDETGYDAAIALLSKAYVAAKDAIMVLPLADGLKALQEFEGFTV